MGDIVLYSQGIQVLKKYKSIYVDSKDLRKNTEIVMVWSGVVLHSDFQSITTHYIFEKSDYDDSIYKLRWLYGKLTKKNGCSINVMYDVNQPNQFEQIFQIHDIVGYPTFGIDGELYVPSQSFSSVSKILDVSSIIRRDDTIIEYRTRFPVITQDLYDLFSKIFIHFPIPSLVHGSIVVQINQSNIRHLESLGYDKRSVCEDIKRLIFLTTEYLKSNLHIETIILTITPIRIYIQTELYGGEWNLSEISFRDIIEFGSSFVEQYLIEKEFYDYIY